MQFRKLTLEDREIYEQFKTYAPDITGWEYSFDVLWVWDVRGMAKVYVDDDMFLIQSCNGRHCVFYPPLTRHPQTDTQKALDRLEQYADRNEIPFYVFGMNKSLLAYIDTERYIVTADRDQFDYIYSADELMHLAGKKFHAKRNYIARFTGKYAYDFREYRPDDRAGIETLYDRWNSETEHETLKVERAAIMRALEYREQLGLKIYVLTVAEKIIAFSVSALDARGIVHTIFEKGDVEYEGVFQMINNLTAKACFAGYDVVNREEDMGIEGLRKAKLSYNPILLYEKYTLERK